MLEKIETVSALRERLASSTKVKPYAHPAHPIGLVPTMGALHAGHAALIDAARRDCSVVVVSIFVNPSQFNNQDDLARYPRTLDADIALCRERGVDIVFAPSVEEVYPQPLECRVDVGHLADHLCGRFRPGHFHGVATVVLKLFQMVQPHRAYFGEKDAQQLAIVRRLAADFNVPIEIVGVPTVREADGLALSSRNRHLSAGERAVAPVLYEALEDARRRIAAGERDASVIRAAAEQYVASGFSRTTKVSRPVNARLEYLEIVDPESMQPVAGIDRAVRIAGAIWVGSTRLIDNIRVPVLRTATVSDAAALARLINEAFVVEAFFKIGDRTSAEEITALMQGGGEFLVLDDLAGCVYVKCTGDRAYFGMLSIDPSCQRRGLGRQLVEAVEHRARDRGCRFMDIHIVDLREELPAYYRRLGYVENGTLPFSEPHRASRPCSFVVMSKAL